MNRDTPRVGWPDIAAMIWADPIGRWVIYVLIVMAFGLAVWRATVKIRAALEEFREDIKITKNQVANDHSKNLRVEQDERHHENSERLLGIDLKLDRVLGILGQHDYRLGALEHTQDREARQ